MAVRDPLPGEKPPNPQRSTQDPFDPDTPMATQAWVLQAIQMLDGVWEKMSSSMEERMEGVDKVLGELTLGYAKLSALVEALVAINISHENKAAFDEALQAGLRKMKESLEYGQEDAHSTKPGFYPTGAIIDDVPDTSNKLADS